MSAPEAKIVVVTGSRDWDKPLIIERVMRRLPAGSTVIHGDARGADTICANYARSMGHEVIAVPADWDQEGRKAGMMRNARMLDMEHDEVIAFHRYSERSPGTAGMIALALQRNEPMRIYYQTGGLVVNDPERGTTLYPNRALQPMALAA